MLISNIPTGKNRRPGNPWLELHFKLVKLPQHWKRFKRWTLIIKENLEQLWTLSLNCWDSDLTLRLKEALALVGLNVTLICPTQGTRAWKDAIGCAEAFLQSFVTLNRVTMRITVGHSQTVYITSTNPAGLYNTVRLREQILSLFMTRSKQELDSLWS